MKAALTDSLSKKTCVTTHDNSLLVFADKMITFVPNPGATVAVAGIDGFTTSTTRAAFYYLLATEPCVEVESC